MTLSFSYLSLATGASIPLRVVVQQNDNGSALSIVDCKYIYNLASGFWEVR
jgi:hypothetical protein